jgi:hypothetical protein
MYEIARENIVFEGISGKIRLDDVLSGYSWLEILYLDIKIKAYLLFCEVLGL